MSKIRKIIIGMMLAFYLAIYTCDKSMYYTYNLTYHTIVLDDYNSAEVSAIIKTRPVSEFYPGKYVKQPANFYPGINMITIREYRFSLN